MKLVLHFIFNIAWLWPAEYQAGQSTLWALVSYLEYLNARNHFNFNKWIVLNVILLICKKAKNAFIVKIQEPISRCHAGNGFQETTLI